ncbi:MarR family winged helix-turn-helix transcriptional regulator [Hydrogenophaga sp. OTU3427]|uniref:MarR family winged helix-turn-helix transcriptional regulator n=1 Tax=Hydrogenophaga sp. OTU3427 TaxID=3043856 RepID=UPI00313D298B
MSKLVDTVKQSTPGPADDVLEAVHTVMHLFRAQQYRVLRDGPHNVTHMDGKVLGFFARHPGATQSELATHSGRDKGQIGRLIAGLKERGLLEARTDDTDRRNVRLQLSHEGKTVQQALERQRRRLADAAVAGLSAGERQQLVSLLDRVRANLDTAP